MKSVKTVETSKTVKSAKTSLRKFPAQGTIGFVVLTELAKTPDVTCEELVAKILPAHPESKFQKTHLAWYKHQVKKNRYILPSLTTTKTKKVKKSK